MRSTPTENRALRDGARGLGRASPQYGVFDRRRAGILLHVTSLPGPFGNGDLGDAAFAFVDFLKRSGQTIWQILPLGPTGYGDSPYQSYSAFAGNPLLVSPERLVEDGLLATSDLDHGSAFQVDQADFEVSSPLRQRLLRKAFSRFMRSGGGALRDEFERFRESEAGWLDDFALFMALKDKHDLRAWTDWPSEIRRREPQAVGQSCENQAESTAFHAFVQFLFQRQWTRLKAYANQQGVLILGDLPIFVSHDSADVWAHQSMFRLDKAGRPSVVAGVPPDYFSETGQRWGNPIYRWDRLAKTGYEWWVNRMAATLRAVDLVRVDHFRGFESYWEIPADTPTAIEGRWVKGPGARLFRAFEARLGRLPIIAEDLGVITPAVEALRDRLGLPGMRVLQFAFGDDPKASDYQPHSYIRHCVAYTGTHDNDTAVGWFKSGEGEGTTRKLDRIDAERDLVLRYLNSDGREIHWDLIRLAWASVANTAIVPMQDVLGLGAQARMNLPGTAEGNWRWRLAPDLLTQEVERRLKEMTELYGRGQ